MTTKPQSTAETLEPCPWCKAVPEQTDLAPSQRYRITHEPTCFLIGRLADPQGRERRAHYIPLREVSVWNSAHSARIPASTAPVVDELVDKVQRRMDQVVEAAVEWHQAGREGTEWFEAAEKLGAAIDSLLELRGEPSQANECFCGTELEAGLCPNGHDPVRRTATSPSSTSARAAAEEICKYLNAFTPLSPGEPLIRIFEDVIQRHSH